jgi:hypothetical protein
MGPVPEEKKRMLKLLANVKIRGVSSALMDRLNWFLALPPVAAVEVLSNIKHYTARTRIVANVVCSKCGHGGTADYRFRPSIFIPDYLPGSAAQAAGPDFT